MDVRLLFRVFPVLRLIVSRLVYSILDGEREPRRKLQEEK